MAATLVELEADRASTYVYAAPVGRTLAWQELFSRFEAIPLLIDEGAETPLPGYGPISDDHAARVASAVGRAVHARLHDAYMRPAGTAVAAGEALMRLASGEVSYEAALGALHEAALQGDAEAAAAVFENLLAAVGTWESQIEGVGLLPVQQRRIGNLGLRSTDLSRRLALLLAGCVLIMRRMSTGPGEAGMRRIAANRTTLRRYDTAQWQGLEPLHSRPEGDNQVVTGEIASIGWVDRPEIPYSYVRLTDGAELRVHRRDIKLNGTVPGALIWVRGKVELDESGHKILVAHFEGPGNHAGDVWEDWLADETRPAYDLYPRVIDANWEFPPLRVQYSTGDLLSRLQEA